MAGLKSILPPSSILTNFPIALSAKPQPTAPIQGTQTEPEEPQSLPSGVILYVGGESLALTNILITHASCKVGSFTVARFSSQLTVAVGLFV